MANIFVLCVLVLVSETLCIDHFHEDHDFLYENWLASENHQDEKGVTERLPVKSDYTKVDVMDDLLPRLLATIYSNYGGSTARQAETTTRPSETAKSKEMTTAQKKCINSCPTTSEYNPVCGSNGISYYNPGKLVCAQWCGVEVTQVRVGKCKPSDVANAILEEQLRKKSRKNK